MNLCSGFLDGGKKNFFAAGALFFVSFFWACKKNERK